MTCFTFAKGIGILDYLLMRLIPEHGGVLEKWCFKQFCEIHRKLSVPESPSNRAASLQLVILFKEVLWHGCFHVNITKFLVTPFPQNPFGKLLLKKLLRLLTMKSIIFPHRKLKLIFCFWQRRSLILVKC